MIVWHLEGGDGGLVPPPLTEKAKNEEKKKVALVKNSFFWAPLAH